MLDGNVHMRPYQRFALRKQLPPNLIRIHSLNMTTNLLVIVVGNGHFNGCACVCVNVALASERVSERA